MDRIIDFIKRLFFPAAPQPIKKVEKPVPVKPTPLPYLADLKKVVLHRGANKTRFNELVKEFEKNAAVYKVTTKLRIAHFWAQMAHETGGFRWFAELGGKSYFSKYDGRRDLGNTQPGDGYRFKGRGIINLTGRHNYSEFGKKIGVDLLKNPEKAAEPAIAILVALEYWTDRDLNKYADADNLKRITKRINGGFNGLRDRENYLKKIKKLDR